MTAPLAVKRSAPTRARQAAALGRRPARSNHAGRSGGRPRTCGGPARARRTGASTAAGRPLGPASASRAESESESRKDSDARIRVEVRAGLPQPSGSLPGSFRVPPVSLRQPERPTRVAGSGSDPTRPTRAGAPVRITGGSRPSRLIRVAGSESLDPSR
jgi:hypothetical protein